jgi:hypothetical protein
LTSGTLIIPGEDPAGFESLQNSLIDEHGPATETETLLLIEMAQAWWLAQRAVRLQNECFPDGGVNEKRLALFLRYQTTHERAFHKALAAFLKLKEARIAEEAVTAGFVSQSRTQQNIKEEKVTPHSGFVSQNRAGEDPKTPPLFRQAA